MMMMIMIIIMISFIFLFVCSRVVKKSKAFVWHARRQRNLSMSKYCVFYNRFGENGGRRNLVCVTGTEQSAETGARVRCS